MKLTCMAHTAVITRQNAGFFEMPQKSRRLSVRQLKQLNIEEKIKNAKNPVSRYILSGEYL
jgi:hypothetical protein